MDFRETPSQTIGPYFAYCMTPAQYGYPFAPLVGNDLTTPELNGERIRIEGCVYDGAGDRVPDAVIEIWQADARGRYPDPTDSRSTNHSFTGFGRADTGTDPENRFVFETIKPGRIDAHQAPYINVIVMMRGLLTHTFTRIYFADEAAANAEDAVFNSVVPGRQSTLLATRSGNAYHFDIHMQGPDETVFFDV